MSLSHLDRALVCAVAAVCVTLQGCASSAPTVPENDVVAIQSDCGAYSTNAIDPMKALAAAKIIESCASQSEDEAKKFECRERPESELEFTYNIKVGQLHNACLDALLTNISPTVTRAAALQSFADNLGKTKVAEIQVLMTEISDKIQVARALAPESGVVSGAEAAVVNAAVNAVYLTTTKAAPWDSFGGSSGGNSLASSASLGTSSDSGASDASNSMGSSGSQASGSSGFYLQLWQWLLVAALLAAGCGAAAMMGKKKPKKKKTKAAPAPAPEAPVAAPAAQPLLPPLMPLAATSTIMPSYSLVAPPATTAFAAHAAYSYAAPASTTYTPGAAMSYAAPAAYAPQYAPQQYASQQFLSPQYASTYAGGSVV